MIESCPIHYWATQTPEHTAVEAPDALLSYRQLDRRVAALAQQLARMMAPGERLLVPARGSLNALLLAWACLRARVVFCPVNPAFPAREQLAMAARLPARFLAQPESVSAELASAKALTALSLDFTTEAEPGEPTLDPEQPSNTIFTSGSSGTPKAVQHRLGNHLASARGSATFIPVDQTSGWLLSLPLFHIGGYAIAFRVFLAGGRVILDDGSPLLARLEQQVITHLSLVPTQLWRLLNAGFDPQKTALHELLLGGAAIPAPLVAKMTALGLTPKVSYGLSEMASQVCTGLPSAPGVVGTPLPGREVRIKEGEIQVRGETLFEGYLLEDELHSIRDDEGWFATRDKGHFNAQGELVVEGRLDNAFISGGENIQPETIEQRLVDHPGIAQALVVPVPHPEWGERPVAFIDYHAAAVEEAELNAWVRETLPGFMVPDAWLPWPEGVGFKPSRRAFAAKARAVLESTESGTE
ncbi:o-succinylbenzoate--CoA ligase [Halomonas aquamarina]|uniref:O-succinylbenzoate--CoA ligase n=1 Tax=Vreelandella aquamarina TaxID=77097 RepID=A0ACC5VX51_9GAMM|nr:o-succinylbenzoate--CoA ligase [Halomonas aquamarina]MBZ5488445.1 o-succinylbenzoate--CoA ligase [Halomonas aquamarina]